MTYRLPFALSSARLPIVSHQARRHCFSGMKSQPLIYRPPIFQRVARLVFGDQFISRIEKRSAYARRQCFEEMERHNGRRVHRYVRMFRWTIALPAVRLAPVFVDLPISGKRRNNALSKSQESQRSARFDDPSPIWPSIRHLSIVCLPISALLSPKDEVMMLFATASMILKVIRRTIDLSIFRVWATFERRELHALRRNFEDMGNLRP